MAFPFKSKVGSSKKIRTHKSRFHSKAPAAAVTAPGWRGEKRRNGGFVEFIPALPKFRGTTRQTCGLWPFGHGSVAPIWGAQLGVHYKTRQPVGFDPLTWFDKRFILNPSCFILSNPAVGKSTLLRKMMIGLMAMGTNCIVGGDRKGEHVELTRKTGGQVITLGSDQEFLNLLDPGEALSAIKRIQEECEDKVLAELLSKKLLSDFHQRRLSLVRGLLSIYRHKDIEGHEESIIGTALRWLHNNEPDRVPILDDLLRVIRLAPPEVRAIANDRGDLDQYMTIIRDLENDLVGLTSGSGLGAMFNGQTTEPIRRDRSVCFDIRSIDESDKDQLSAAYLACWAASFGMIDVAHALTDAGLEESRRFLVVLDEFWQPLAASPGMVDRVNSITRLNRDKGVATAYASHTLSDLEALPDTNDRAKAIGIVSRCGCVVLGGLDRRELTERVSKVSKLRNEEISLLVSWNSPPSLDGNADMPGRGKFLVKIGEAPGVPIEVLLTRKEIEMGLHDTNKRIRARVRATREKVTA